MLNINTKKIIISFLVLNIIPAISVLLDIYLSNWKNLGMFIYLYNHSSSILISMKSLWNNSSIVLTAIIVIYNFFISLFLYYISWFTRKYIITISIIIAVIVSFFWWLLAML